jgi:hypothetical protein
MKNSDRPIRIAAHIECVLMDESREVESRSEDYVNKSEAKAFARGVSKGLSDAASIVRVETDKVTRSPAALLADRCFEASLACPGSPISALLVEVGNYLDVSQARG